MPGWLTVLESGEIFFIISIGNTTDASFAERVRIVPRTQLSRARSGKDGTRGVRNDPSFPTQLAGDRAAVLPRDGASHRVPEISNPRCSLHTAQRMSYHMGCHDRICGPDGMNPLSPHDPQAGKNRRRPPTYPAVRSRKYGRIPSAESHMPARVQCVCPMDGCAMRDRICALWIRSFVNVPAGSQNNWIPSERWQIFRECQET